MTDRSVAEKLQIKPGRPVWAEPAAQRALLGPLPVGVDLVDVPSQAGVAVIFAADGAALRAVLDRHRDAIKAVPILWVAYPKANRSDINRETLWPILHGYGMRPNSQIAIDEVWSALRFRALRPGETFDYGGRGGVPAS